MRKWLIAFEGAGAAPRCAVLASSVKRWMPEEFLLKLGDEQGGVRIKGTGSLPPPSAPPPGDVPSSPRRSSGGGWNWMTLAIVIVGIAALYVVWRML